MNWLLQNWIWIVFVVGVFLLLRRGGIACGMGSGRHPDRNSDHIGYDTRDAKGPTDPVSGERVIPETALTSMYQGRIYYFSSKENREKFEASPGKHLSAAASQDGPHHRHGC